MDTSTYEECLYKTKPKEVIKVSPDSDVVKCITCKTIVKDENTEHTCRNKIEIPLSLCHCNIEKQRKIFGPVTENARKKLRKKGKCRLHIAMRKPINAWPFYYKMQGLAAWYFALGEDNSTKGLYGESSIHI